MRRNDRKKRGNDSQKDYHSEGAHFHVIPDEAPAEFRNLAFDFQRSAASFQHEEIDSCIRRNDRKKRGNDSQKDYHSEGAHFHVIPDEAPAEFRNLVFGFQRSAASFQHEEIDSCIRRNDSHGRQE
jgi:hypothetical protein